MSTKVAHYNKVWPKANKGYVYAYDRTDCKGYLGKAKGNVAKYSKKANDKATSLLNKGTGRYDTVVFYEYAHYKGGEACLKRGEKFADDIRDNTLSNGRTPTRGSAPTSGSPTP
ncbi:peptidase inhibitor family I36 protein [Streptomyces sp. UG1]|uniref:peptidase inhibitor family I36 protein n=1 Tax=Streptomyces sp. UG1 TaxID=3417652 RepID=UPI003CF481B1